METLITPAYNKNDEEEKKLILREYRALLRALKQRIKKGDKRLLRRAFEIAADAHKDMRRKSGEPYILHPVAVARIVVEEIGLGVTSAICALLHDVVEDTEITLEDIEQEFGDKFAKIIDGLTKISNVVDLKAGHYCTGRKFQEDITYAGRGPACNIDKAGRPPAQHAHTGQHEQGEAVEDIIGDNIHIRTTGASPWIV